MAGLESASDRCLETETELRSVGLCCGVRGRLETGCLAGGIVGGEESWVRSIKSSKFKLSSSLSGQGVTDLSEPVNEVSESERPVSGADGGGCRPSGARGGVEVDGCGKWVTEGGGRPEELEEVPVGSVARGKLGGSRCERFLGWAAVSCRLTEVGVLVMPPQCCCGGSGRSRALELSKESRGRNKSLLALGSHDSPRLKSEKSSSRSEGLQMSSPEKSSEPSIERLSNVNSLC